MPLENADVAAITLLLSPERLAALTTLTGSARTAIDLHQETLSLSACLMNVTACIEIALRNAVSENLTVHFGTPRWLTHPPVPFVWRRPEQQKATMALNSARRAEYAKLSQAGKAALDALAFPHGVPANTSHHRRTLRRQDQISVSDGMVISETTLFFWKRLYGPEYEQTLWRTTLKRTFPNKRLRRADVARHLEVLYQARNRLAHHEPVLHRRFRDAVASIEFIAQNLGAATPASDTPLAKLIADELQVAKDKAAALHARLDAFRNPPAPPAPPPAPPPPAASSGG